MIKFLSLIVVLCSALAANVHAQKRQSPVVVELFTSQSCSSCPAADKILDELSAQKDIIALSCHVTYWNHLSWKDTLGRDFCTKRQNFYADVLNSSRVYTPQMIINGRDEFVGSRRSQAKSTIAKALSDNKVAPVALAKNGNSVTVSLSPYQKAPYTLWLMGYRQEFTQNIQKGENRGRTVTYKNAAMAMENLGPWSGEAREITLPVPDDPNIDGLAVIAQKNYGGSIAAAGKLDF